MSDARERAVGKAQEMSVQLGILVGTDISPLRRLFERLDAFESGFLKREKELYDLAETCRDHGSMQLHPEMAESILGLLNELARLRREAKEK